MSRLLFNHIHAVMNTIHEIKTPLCRLTEMLWNIKKDVAEQDSLAAAIDAMPNSSNVWSAVDSLANERYRIIYKDTPSPRCYNYTTNSMALAIEQLTKGIYHGHTGECEDDSFFGESGPQLNKVDILKLSDRCRSGGDSQFAYLSVLNKPEFNPLPTYWIIRAFFENVESTDYIKDILTQLGGDIDTTQKYGRYYEDCANGKCAEKDDNDDSDSAENHECRCEENFEQSREVYFTRVRELFHKLMQFSVLSALWSPASEALGGREHEFHDFKITVFANEKEEREHAERKALQEAAELKRKEEELAHKRKYAAQDLARAKKAMAALNNPKKKQSK